MKGLLLNTYAHFCWLYSLLYMCLPYDRTWPENGIWHVIFSTHKNRKPTTRRSYTPIECIDIPRPATVLCTTYCSQHISTAEINTFRHL